MQTNSYSNLAILAVANAFAFLAMPLVVFVASLVGIELASSEDLATIPVAAMIIGTALGIWPVARVNARFGRKWASMLFMGIGVVACLLCAQSIVVANFWLFVAGTGLLGFGMAAVQQFRYAAIECLGKERAATAASIVLSGGIFAAIAGPELALIGKSLTAIDYQGSFWMAAGCLCLSAVILQFFTFSEPSSEAERREPSAIHEMINPGFCLAICSGAVSYAVMSFIMTATPISMHHHYMHSLEGTKFVIQSHILAMFLPSLVSPFLFRWFGILNMMKIGLAAFVTTIFIGFYFTSLTGFWIQLVILGIGWNFLFVAGTAMLPTTHHAQDRFTAQAINDGLVFGMQALASVGAGIVLARLSWAQLVSIGFIPIVTMAALMVFYHWTKKENLSARA